MATIPSLAWPAVVYLMKCPVAVTGREYGAEATGQKNLTTKPDGTRVIHCDCKRGHGYHAPIPCDRWEAGDGLEGSERKSWSGRC